MTITPAQTNMLRAAVQAMAEFQAAAQDRFASDAGYKSWADMCERADEFGGNSVEIREVMENGRMGSALECAA